LTTAPRFTRRRALEVLLGVAGLGALGAGTGDAFSRAIDRWSRFSERATESAFPPWVTRSPRTREAYEQAYARLGLMATLPCYCGCGAFKPPHVDLSTCFRRPSGQIEQHAAGCTTCQDEALDAARWDSAGVPWLEIHTRIVAAYSDVGPPTPGRHT
jgi:hypothetical protein